MSALIAFDAAARHQSVTRAADELSLTESAVSRQISLLEEQLEVRLFHRIKKRISLTRAGARYSSHVTRMLGQIERDTLEAMAQGGGSVLEIAALPTVGAQWLVPLGDFYARWPEVTVNISARSGRFLFSETALDGSLHFGSGAWPGAVTDRLFDEVLVPVGRPELFGDGGPPDAGRIAGQRLLHLMTRPDAWREWCEAAGIGGASAMRGPRFEIQSMVIGAACAGQGVALLPRFLVLDHLAAGRLQVLSEQSVRSEGSYYFAYPEDKADDACLGLFRDWLLEQARGFGEG